MRASKHALSAVVIALLGLGTWSVQARADVTQNFQSDTEFLVQDCDGNFIDVVTHYHGVIRDKVNRDGSITEDFSVNAHGTGTNLVTGTTYVFNDTYHQTDTFVSATPSGALHWRTRLTSPGSADNVVILTTYTYHIDENGNFIFDTFNVSTDCHG